MSGQKLVSFKKKERKFTFCNYSIRNSMRSRNEQPYKKPNVSDRDHFLQITQGNVAYAPEI